MQRLAEDYARVRYPDRFPRFDFRAISKEGKSRPGWPDAFASLEDGRVNALEATSEKDRSKVWKHLDQDVDKARKWKPTLAGLVFLSGQPDIQPSEDRLRRWRQKLVKAGLESEHIDLVFGGRLVQELAGPEFARTRLEVLGISDLPDWFELVRPKVPPNPLQAVFVPSPSEYERWVHWPQVAEDIHARLEVEGRALVYGVGASGKTVLAWSFATEWYDKRRPSYYLDLAGLGEQVFDVGNGLEKDLFRFGHPSALFILDNIHLDEHLAAKLLVAWGALDFSQRPCVLILGRELRGGRASPIAGLGVPPITLRARQAEVRGVYRRLVHRHTGSDTIPEPPSEVLDAWVDTFGGDPAFPDTTTDLIAFSAAVLKRMPDLLNQQWLLSEADAIDEIREAYLKKIPDSGEISNLMRLAALADCELALPEQALGDRRAAFDVSSRSLGLVFREEVGSRRQYVRYRFAHSALGRLFLEAAFEPIDQEAERFHIALAYPLLGVSICNSLAKAGLDAQAARILLALTEDPRRLLTPVNLGYLLMAFRLMQRLKVPILADTGHRLTDPDNLERLTKCALVTPFDLLRAFLAYAENTEELEGVFGALTSELGKAHNLEPLTKRALATPLGDLRALLTYAEKTEELEGVFGALTSELGKVDNLEPLTKSALATPLGHLRGFLAYAEKTEELEGVFGALTSELGKAPNLEPLTKSALLTPLQDLQIFLEYAEKAKKLKRVFDAVGAELAKKENVARLIEQFCRTTTGNVLRILSSDTCSDLWAKVLLGVDQAKWDHIQMHIALADPQAFVSFQAIVSAKGRPELAATPAHASIRFLSRQPWDRTEIGIHHVSHLIRCAPDATESELRVLLDRVATPQWLDEQFSNMATTGGLAGSLDSLNNNLPSTLTARFIRSSLRYRVIRELRTNSRKEHGLWAEIISLLGAATAIGVRIGTVAADWPLPTDLSAILLLRAPSRDSTAIGHLQIQLWAGLREMVRLREDAVSVPPEYGDAVLDLWRATVNREADQPRFPYRRKLDSAMITWLECCQRNSWLLVKEEG